MTLNTGIGLALILAAVLILLASDISYTAPVSYTHLTLPTTERV